MVHLWLNELLLQFKLYSVYNPCWTSLSSRDILPARKENYSRQSPSCDIEMRLDALSEPTKNLPSQSLVSMPSTNLIPIKKCKTALTLPRTTPWWRKASNWNAQAHPCVYSQHHSCSGLTSKNEIKLEDRLRLRERRKKSKSHHIADPFFWSQELNCCTRSL